MHTLFRLTIGLVSKFDCFFLEGVFLRKNIMIIIRLKGITFICIDRIVMFDRIVCTIVYQKGRLIFVIFS